MFTIAYKGTFIHGYVDKDECKVQFVTGKWASTHMIHCRSIHAAKCYITKLHKRLA